MTARGTVETLLDAARRAGPLTIPILGVAASVATFMIWGLVPSLVFACVLLVLAVIVVASVAGESRAPREVSAASAPPVAFSAPSSVEAMLPAPPSENLGERSGEDPASPESPPNANEPEPLMQAISAAFEGDVRTTAARMDEYMASQEGAEKSERAQALKEHLLVKAGDGLALGRLRKLAEESQQPDVLTFFASSLGWLGQPAAAAEFLLAAVDRVPAGDRALLELEAAEHLLEAASTSDADRIAEGVLSRQGTPVSVRARGFSVRAKASKGAAPVRAMLFYELALREDPSRSGDRFALAYLYSDHSLYGQAISHYRVLVENHQATPVAYNNLAVAYSHAGLPFKSSDYYGRAIEKGSALAAANLAHLAINVGDAARAAELLKRGAELDADDARLVSATERLATGRRNEEEKAETLALAPREVSAVMLKHSVGDTVLPDLLETDWTFAGRAVTFEKAKYTAGYSVTIATGMELTLNGSGTYFQADGAIAAVKYKGVGYVEDGRLVVLLNEVGGPAARALVLLPPTAGT